MPVGNAWKTAVEKLIEERNLGWNATYAAKVLPILEDARQHVVAAIASSKGFDLAYYETLKKKIEGLIDDAGAAINRELQTGTPGAMAAGKALPLEAFRLGGAAVKVPIISLERGLVQAFATYTADLITGISVAAKQNISGEILRGIMAGTRPEDVIAAIGKNLDDPSIFKSVADRAETIYRTETARAFNLGQKATDDYLKKRHPEMKYLLVLGDRPCDECVARINAQSVYDEYFDPTDIHPNCCCGLVEFLPEFGPPGEN